MIVIAHIRRAGRESPPPGTPILVEVRDTSYADEAATILATVRTEVIGELGSWLATAEVQLQRPAPRDRLAVWAHVDVDRDGAIGHGDFITTVHHPLPEGDDEEILLVVTVNRV